MSACRWKPNWAQTQSRLNDWWERRGIVLGMWGAPPASAPVAEVPFPEPKASLAETYTDPEWRARQIHASLACKSFPVDVLPLAETDLGPGSLALYLGSEPTFAPDTVWFSHPFEDLDDPTEMPALRFDPANPWWGLTVRQLRACRALAGENYILACPDLIEGLDILATLREPQNLMMDMLEEPEWVEAKLVELSQVWIDVYARIYEEIRLADGSSAYGPFYIWGPGKTAKLQCDSSAMFSPDMFERFALPSLRAQCDWLDHSLYHLDGTQSIHHLDHLLSIESLDAIEWTPQAGIETGGHPRWYPLYRRILDAGKSVQVVNIEPAELAPLFDAIGTEGVYAMMQFTDAAQAAEMEAIVERYR